MFYLHEPSLFSLGLFYIAAVMKDESQPLSAYGLRPGARVMLLASSTAEVRETINTIYIIIFCTKNKRRKKKKGE